MSKKFYLVKDGANSITGGYWPYKIYGYSPYIQPMAIKKSPGLTLNLAPPQTISPTLGFPFAPQFNLTGKPSEPVFVPNLPVVMGAPIIKYGLLPSNGTIRIMFGNNIISLNVPFTHFRRVVNDIYNMAFVNLDPTEPKITVRITGMGTDTTIQTTTTKMWEILNHLDSTYDNITYNHNNVNYSYGDIYSRFG
jgi:hypothetical protein